MRDLCKRLARDETGATAIEYALIAGIISLSIIIGVSAIRDGLDGILNTSADELKR
jgi:pilus assembly protein Flp/PilA